MEMIKQKAKKPGIKANTGLCGILILALSGCGGGSDSSGNGNDGWVAGVFRDADNFVNRCETPRAGINPATGMAYPDMQGSSLDEKNWLRSMSNDLYLWYDEIIDINPALVTDPVAYFDRLVTNETTPSGADKDQFHFTVDSDAWFDESQNGISAGYGANVVILASFPPREAVVAYTDPGTPAAAEGFTRGARILEIDGVDLINGNDVATLNAGLFPETVGETHEFVIQDLGSNSTRTINLTSAEVTSVPVQNVTVIPTASGDVGYLTFNDHIATAEEGLVDAVNTLASAGITDLVLDVRYNGGGFLAIASQLAYMIAGDAPTIGETFELIKFNDKHPTVNPVTNSNIQPTPFINTTIDFSVPFGQALPTLNLSRVFVLTGANTCSASESIINGLRGIDIEVYQFGSTTCGKPYGFYEMPNCGTSYFTIQFEGENAKGFSEYADGFAPQNTLTGFGELLPGCSVGDDLENVLGDPSEGRLAAALNYRAQLDLTGTGTCPAASGFSQPGLSNSLTGQALDRSNANSYVTKHPGLEGKIIKPEYNF